LSWSVEAVPTQASADARAAGAALVREARAGGAALLRVHDEEHEGNLEALRRAMEAEVAAVAERAQAKLEAA
jgi:hypothetical protein